jgi:hypothetical protein
MRSGTIDLASGRWHWTLLPQWTGATVVFQHRDRVHDEMRSWTPEMELTDDEARELALDALERVWADVDGLKWRLSIELPSDWRYRGQSEGDDASLWLIFKRGGVRRMVAIPASSRIGDLTHTELLSLLDLASRSSPEPG